MRQIYTSPRSENINRVVALMAEHGIQASVQNRSNWNTPGHRRFSYLETPDARDSWEQVWIEHADDYTRARALMRELGIEPPVRFGAELAAARSTTPTSKRRNTVARVRRIVLLAVVGVFVLIVLRYIGMR